MAGQLTGLLSDNDIRQYFGTSIKIFTEERSGEYSFDLDKQLQLASVDLRFRGDCKRFLKKLEGNLDYQKLKNHAYTEPFEIERGELLVINPGEVIFTTTLETISISNEFAGLITGRSSIARMGIMVHCCQEFINPGVSAPIPLQIINMGQHPVELDMRTPICQLVLFKLCSAASDSYSKMKGAKYADEKEVMNSQLHLESKPDAIKKVTSEHNGPGKLLNKIIRDFLPGVIAFLLIEPIIESSKKASIEAVLDYLSNIPLHILVLVIAVGLYLFGFSKGGKDRE